MRRDHGLAAQLTEVRRIVEVGAASLAARRRTAEDLRRMREALTRAEAALDERDVEAFSQADIDFHQAVLGACGNHFVPALLVPVDAALREIRLQTSEDVAASRRALVMHGRVHDAVRRRAGQAAADAMRLHLDETRRHIESMTDADDARRLAETSDDLSERVETGMSEGSAQAAQPGVVPEPGQRRDDRAVHRALHELGAHPGGAAVGPTDDRHRADR